MHRPIRLSLGAAACILAFACSNDTQSPTPEAPTYAVSDGAHNGNPDFFFLPPLFKNPVNEPTYEPNAANLNLKPSVEICELGAPAGDGSRECIAGPPVKVFGPSAVTVVDQSYQVNWKTDETPLNISKFYRIRVLVGAALLGFADVDPVSSTRELKNVQTNEYIPLQDGRTLPIKFRIESGALCAVDGTPCASETVNLNQGGEIELLGAGEDFRVVIPSGTTATFGDQTVTDVTFNLEVCDGIDVDLPLYGPCLRISTFFTATGDNELEFSNRIRISLCVLSEEIHTPDETRQQGLITLHQQDGTLIRALPHVAPDCGEVIGSSGWQWLRHLAARLLLPKPALAASRTALLHVGGGGETGTLGAKCTPPPPASPRERVPGIMMATTCPPSSPMASGPQRAAAAAFTPPNTVSDFQFALPAKMDYVNPADAQRNAAPGTALPTAVRVTDWDGAGVQGATVHFIEPPLEGPGEGTEVGTAISDENGIAQILWTIREGSNHVVATGRGIAARNNYPNPDDPVKPFMPDISLPTAEQEPVALGTGRIHFFATGAEADLIIESLTHSPLSPTDVDLMEFGVTVKNIGTAATGPFYVIVTTSSPGLPTETTTLVGLATPGSSLAAGESRTLCCFRSYRVAGDYTQFAQADFHSQPELNNQVPESNEDNNTLLDRYTVTTVNGLFAVGRDAPGASSEIFRFNSDGTGSVNLSNDPAIDAQPAWSPDGTKLAFQSRRTDVGDVWVMNADGSSPVNLTNNPDAFEISPSWSGDGTKIAYMNRTPFDQIFVMNADGTNNTFVAGTAAANAGFPSFSPDGSRIAFATQRDGDSEIYAMNADGSNPINLTQNPGFDLDPVWSPDGTKIAWFTSRDGNGEIYVMNADGSNPVNVTRNPGLDRLGGWSPDSRYLVFSSDRDGNDEIYITTLDGFFVKRITTNTVTDLSPSWRR